MSSAPARLIRAEIEREVNSAPFWWHSVEINGEGVVGIFFNELDVIASLANAITKVSAEADSYTSNWSTDIRNRFIAVKSCLDRDS